MTTEQHINRLEKDINHINETVSDVKEQLKILVSLVNEMNKGLYGDAKNDHIGVIARQMIMNQEISELKQKIHLIEQKNVDQDLMIKTSKGIKHDYREWGIRVVGWVIQAFIIYIGLKYGIDIIQ